MPCACRVIFGGPRPAAGYSVRRVGAAIKARLRYAEKTKTIRAALASLKS